MSGPAVPWRGAPVAAVDCGTNSTRLLVAGSDGASLERLMRITRLGKGVDRTGRLDGEAIRRTVAVLREYREVMNRLGVTETQATATSAVRDATNATEFPRASGRSTGIGAEGPFRAGGRATFLPWGDG